MAINSFVMILTLTVTTSLACVPHSLTKYFGGGNQNEIGLSEKSTVAMSSKKPPVSAESTSNATNRNHRTSIVAIEPGIFRIHVGFDRVWDATLDVLIRNYNLAIADRSNGLITTEWDSYFLSGKVHRNKISIRIKRFGSAQVEMTVSNNVEALSKLPDGGITEIWLPTDQSRAEIERVVQNLAIAMGQAKPDLGQQDVKAAGSVPSEKARM